MTLLYEGPLQTTDEILQAIASLRTGLVAIDTETVSLKNRNGIGVGISFGPHSLYASLFPDIDESIPEIFRVAYDPNLTKIYHNAMFDLRVLDEFAWNEGYSTPDTINIQDTSIMAQVTGRPASLDASSLEFLGRTNSLSIRELLDETGRGSTMLDVPFEQVGAKNLQDTRYTLDIYPKLRSLLQYDLRAYDCYEVDRQLISVLLAMEKKGLGLRHGNLLLEQSRLKREVLSYTDTSEELGLNLGSGAQVGYVLASRGNILPFTKSKRQLRTDEEALENLDDPLAQMVLAYRGATKLLSTYIEPYLLTDRAKTHFRIDLATGRLASFDRNMQNIPPDIRHIFQPDKDVYSWMDYSQIELRCLAWMSKDKVMLEAYASGQDLHQLTADAGGVPRDAGKTYNFAKVYGASDFRLQRRTGVTMAKVKELRLGWDKLYPEAAYWINDLFNNHGDYVVSDFGRKMLLPTVAEDGVETKAFIGHVNKCAVNYAVQGTAADIIKRAMLKLRDSDTRLQVHDELLVDGEYEFPPELNNIHPELETPFSQYQDMSWK